MQSRQARDASETTGLLEAPAPENETPAEAVSDWQVAVDVWPAALALGVSVGCATLFFPFFTYVKSSGWLGTLLPQV